MFDMKHASLSSPFGFRNRMGRVIWGWVYIIFFRYSPRPFHAWRSFLLRIFGAKLGRHVHIYPSVKIWAPWNLAAGDRVGVGDFAVLYNQDLITIGGDAVISQGVHLCTGTHDYTTPEHRLFTRPIYIGAFAWICAEVFVHPGVRIGDGAVISARAVVVKDMPAWMVSAGHPCHPIKKRNWTGSK